MCEVKFRSRLLKTDVTAIKIVKDVILTGIGGDIHVFKNHKPCSKHRIFDGENIFGISFDPHRLLLLTHTGLRVKILNTNHDFTECTKKHYITASDWILDLKWLDEGKIGMVLMNNTVQLLNCELGIEETYKCEESCILYSGQLHDTIGGATVFSGTVFNEVVMWKVGGSCEVLRRLKGHKGVIFSIDYNPDINYLCTTSDDRSAILWKLNQDEKIQVYGHSSRIFRCKLTTVNFLTAGEDSLVNIWSFNGELLRKIDTLQRGPIWSLDCDNSSVVTGGNDSGVLIHPIRIECLDEELSSPNGEGPKLIGVLDGGNLVVFSETGELYYFRRSKGVWSKICKHEELKSYALLQVSRCRNMVALAGFNGEIFIYQQIHNNLKPKLISRTSPSSRIFSLHWLSCKTLLICQNEGIITLLFIKSNNFIPITNFLLPLSKERWTTCAVNIGEFIIVGDRRGNVILYKIGDLKPVQVLKKVHSSLGVTRLLVRDEKGVVVTMGKDAMVKTFQFDGKLRLVSENKMKFSWILNCFNDIFAGFSGNNFVLWHNGFIFSKLCGGGHRSYDVTTNLFTYIKNKTVHVVPFDLNSLLPVELIHGYHVREVNALELIQICDGRYVLVSGGEDTTIRTTIVKTDSFDTSSVRKSHLDPTVRTTVSFHTTTVLKSHLSSIRTITSTKINETYSLVFSAGGRAQVICWKLDYSDATMSLMDSYYKLVSDYGESEMRIMDMVVSGLMLYCACSDGIIKIFKIKEESCKGNYTLHFYRDVSYKLKCLTKVNLMSNFVLTTMGTDGLVNFWNVPDLLSTETIPIPFTSIKSNQSGINSSWIKSINDQYSTLCTGGDDNAISLNLLSNVTLIDQLVDVQTHCAQITGVFMNNYRLITASIDQKIAVFKYEVIDERIKCKLLGKYCTSVTDVQGIKCVDKNGSFDCVVYGNGVEILEIVT